MKILLSPTKKQIINTLYKGDSSPFFLSKSQELISEMLLLGRDGIKELLGISDKLADDNWSRILDWNNCENIGSASIFTFVGEVFNYLDPITFNSEDLKYANDVLRIFSGLYGILKPMDSIKPYRLDIKDSLKLKEYTSLYNFWKPDLTSYLEEEITKDENRLIIDLSSKEYSTSVNLKSISGTIITPDFKTEVNGKLKTVAIWSKRMRGLLTREIILNRVDNQNDLKNIKLPGYSLDNTENGNYLYIKK